LASKPNLRLLAMPSATTAQTGYRATMVSGGVLVQTRDCHFLAPEAMRVVSQRHPSAEEWGALCFAERVCAYAKSNAIVLARSVPGGYATVGIGSGQVSRVDSVCNAIMRANSRAKASEGDANPVARSVGAVLASDAFFPFADGVEEAARAGVTAVLHPGGSVRDPEVIAAADAHGMAMVCTGIRHFLH
jgi:phosphoribosylaminoimidazolecarboxamide formyltransferase/IMP cyclohydrolase